MRTRIERMQQVSDMPDSLTRRRALYALGRLCKNNRILPASAVVSAPVFEIPNNPLFRSGVFDVYTGKLNNAVVAVRRPRVYRGDLDHDNILSVCCVFFATSTRMLIWHNAGYLQGSRCVAMHETCERVAIYWSVVQRILFCRHLPSNPMALARKCDGVSNEAYGC